jgi:hypothetical protein
LEILGSFGNALPLNSVMLFVRARLAGLFRLLLPINCSFRLDRLLFRDVLIGSRYCIPLRFNPECGDPIVIAGVQKTRAHANRYSPNGKEYAGEHPDQ